MGDGRMRHRYFIDGYRPDVNATAASRSQTNDYLPITNAEEDKTGTNSDQQQSYRTARPERWYHRTL